MEAPGSSRPVFRHGQPCGPEPRHENQPRIDPTSLDRPCTQAPSRRSSPAPTVVTGSSSNPALEVNAVSGGARVDQGLELGGWVLVRPGLPPSVEGDGGVSQERMARKALGQQGCWGWWCPVGPPLWPLFACWHQGPGWGKPLVPAEGGGAVDEGLVAADGEVGADLEVSPAEFVLDLLVALP